MTSVLIVGCGDLGSEVARLLVASDYEVTGIRRSDKPLNNIRCIQADVTDKATLAVLENFSPDIVVYCVAAGARTDESYRQHYVDGLKHVLAMQELNASLQHIFFVSSTRVYGQQTDSLLDESHPAEATDFGGKRLLEAEYLLKTAKCNTTALRLSGIYGDNRLYMVNMSKDVSQWPVSNKWTNRIHRDDAARFVALLCNKVVEKEAVSDCYIVTDDEPSLQYDVLNWLQEAQGLATSQVASPPTKGGKRLSNQRLKATGFQLKYPSYKIGYSEILQNI